MSTKNKNKVHSIDGGIQKKSGQNRKMMIGTVVILAIVIVSFVLAPAFSGGGQGGKVVFGRYGNREIAMAPNNFFSRRLDSINQYYRDTSSMGDNVGFLRQIIWQQAFDETVFHEALLYQLERSHFWVSPKAVDRMIVERGPFSPNDEFDENLYKQASASYKKELRDTFREGLAVETWSTDTLRGVYRSEAQLAFIEGMSQFEQDYEFVSFPFSSYPEEKVKEYALANEKLFSTLRVSRITVENEEKAQEVMTLLDAGERPFDEIARNESTDSYSGEGGMQGWTPYHELSDDITVEETDEIFALGPEGIAGPFESSYGWIIFRVEQEANVPEIDEIIEDVRAYMEKEEIGLIEDTMLAQAGDFLSAARKTSLKEAAEAQGREIKQTGHFPVNFGGERVIGTSPDTEKNPVLVNAVRSEEFWTTLLPLDSVGELSETLVLGKNVLIFSLLDRKDTFTTPEEDRQNWRRLRLDAEFSQIREEDYSEIIKDSPLLVDNFLSEYNRIIPEG